MSKKKLPWRCKDERQAKDKNRIYASKRWQELRVLKIQSCKGLCDHEEYEGGTEDDLGCLYPGNGDGNGNGND